jgi:tellurite resistance protein
MTFNNIDGPELLKAVLVMACVDGRISGREKGLIRALAARAGVGDASLSAMINQVQNDPDAKDRVFKRAVADPEKAMQLLVATANLDGRITEEEREMLVDVSFLLGVSAQKFNAIFQAGMAASKKPGNRLPDA